MSNYCDYADIEKAAGQPDIDLAVLVPNPASQHRKFADGAGAGAVSRDEWTPCPDAISGPFSGALPVRSPATPSGLPVVYHVDPKEDCLAGHAAREHLQAALFVAAREPGLDRMAVVEIEDGAAATIDPSEVHDRLFRKLQLIDDATCDLDLQPPPSNHFEKIARKFARQAFDPRF